MADGTTESRAPADLRDRYLDLVVSSIADEIYGESRLETWARAAAVRLRHPWQTRRWKAVWPARAHSMLGRPLLSHLRGLVETVLREGVPGDFIETGVWRGGACILMRAVLAAHGETARKVFVADSFEGLPRPDAARYPADSGDRLFKFGELAISEAEVRRNFAAYGLLDDQVVFLKGLFKDSLPSLKDHPFALIRLDGDMYESTMDGLVNLYDGLANGGCVVIDDYWILESCRKAVHDFLDSRGQAPVIEEINGKAVWWRKT